jgi:hypothetical protein
MMQQLTYKALLLYISQLRLLIVSRGCHTLLACRPDRLMRAGTDASNLTVVACKSTSTGCVYARNMKYSWARVKQAS